ncbi:hypothetical protein FACS1894159_05180 [Bacteroidia bacterium]|nr:hypothetical protein FACS1894159_05180 [Bacteroidia bacterium]
MRFFAAAFAAAALLASCVKESGDKPEVGPGGVAEGLPTYASFNFKFDEPTKVALNSDALEASTVAVNDIRLLVFKNTSASTVCEVNELVTAPTANSTRGVQLTSGLKKIFVVVNGAAAGSVINGKLTGITPNTTTLNDFYNTISKLDVGVGDTSPATDTYSVSDLLVTSGMILTSAIDASSTHTLDPGISQVEAEAGGNNNITLKVKRALAKAKVVYDNALVDGSNIITADNLGVLNGLQYSLRNVRRSTYLFQQFLGGAESTGTGVLSPSYGTIATPTYAAFFPFFYSQAVQPASATPNGVVFDYANMLNDATDKTNPGPSYYLTENTNGSYMWGNASMAPVKAVYLPKAGGYVSSATYNPTQVKFTALTAGSTPITAATTLYRLKSVAPVNPAEVISDFLGLSTKSVFTDQNLAYQTAFSIAYPTKKYDVPTDATAYATFISAAGNSGDYIDTYTGGVCYYQLFLGAGDNTVIPSTFQYGVTRNNIYRAVIKKFSGIGSSTEDGGTDPKTPLEEKTYVDVVIDIDPWLVLDSNINL